MKASKKWLVSLISTLTLSAALLSMTACGGARTERVRSAEINSAGQLIITYENGTRENLGAVNVKNGSAIPVDGEGDVSAATAIGLCSAVSITAGFTESGKNPGAGAYPGFSSGKKYSTAGSGVIYRLDSSDGSAFIITNYHVIFDNTGGTGVSNDINVYLYGREAADYGIRAEYVGGSSYYDIAVLRVDSCAALRDSVYRAAAIAEPGSAAVGDRAIAIGNPESCGISASQGIISVSSEYITMKSPDHKKIITQRVMRVDTAVNSGNSGGGLYDDCGRLIGIVNAKIVDESVENIGYAIPAEVATAVADNIIDNCYGKSGTAVMRASLGISLAALDSRAVISPDTGDVTVAETVSVRSITPGSAAQARLREGDVLLTAEIGGKSVEITRQHHVTDLMLTARVGDTLKITLERGGEISTVEIPITGGMISAY